MTRGDQRPPAVDTGEKATLVAFLDYVREAVIAKTAGVSDEVARRPAVGSGTSLLWLLRHLARAEHRWFVWYYASSEVWRGPEADAVEDADTLEGLVAAYRAKTAETNAIVEAADLDAVGSRVLEEGVRPPTMRWVLIHMIEETARHAGHADIIREQADGTVGR
ncbi:DinB family protein [Actinoplanes sp. NPDC089786]|uniref:DinB family protein n=1 Tax=Actinoplanes sp. NPDC089786 TaxID=3155185 RepID=UPI00342759B0